MKTYREELENAIRLEIPPQWQQQIDNNRINENINKFILYGNKFLYSDTPCWFYRGIHKFLNQKKFKKHFLNEVSYRWGTTNKKEQHLIYKQFIKKGLKGLDDYGFLSSGIAYLDGWKNRTQSNQRSGALKDWKFSWNRRNEDKNDWREYRLTFRQGIKKIIDDFLNQRVNK